MTSEYPIHLVRNPLALFVGCSEYKDGLDNLPGVKVDLKVLYELFHGFYGWIVKSIHQNVTKTRILDFFDEEKAKSREFFPSHLLLLLLFTPNLPPFLCRCRWLRWVDSSHGRAWVSRSLRMRGRSRLISSKHPIYLE